MFLNSQVTLIHSPCDNSLIHKRQVDTAITLHAASESTGSDQQMRNLCVAKKN